MTNVFQAPDQPKAGYVEPVAAEAAGSMDSELLVDFNTVVQASLESFKARLNQLHAIIRCDNMPHIQVRKGELQQLSDRLFHMILLHPPYSSKLFIYIKCNRINSDLLPSGLFDQLHTYEICLHTNSCNDISWQSDHEGDLKECTAVCTKYGGGFYASYGHLDCLFKVTLPGKFI